jgi:hypothetical protein
VITAIVCLLTAITAIELARLLLDSKARRRPAIDRYVGQRLVLHLKDTTASVRGVLAETAPDALVLARAEHLEGRAVVPLDGVQVIERGGYTYFQVLGPDTGPGS